VRVGVVLCVPEPIVEGRSAQGASTVPSRYYHQICVDLCYSRKENKIPLENFYVNGLSEKVDIKMDYLKWATRDQVR